MKKTKKKVMPSSKTAKARKKNNNAKAEIAAICTASLGILIFLCVYAKDSVGPLGKGIYNFMRGLFGIGAYMVPAVIVALVVYYFVSKETNKRNMYIKTAVAFLDLIAIFHVLFSAKVSFSKIYEHSIKEFSGGLIGSCIATPLLSLIGTICTFVVLLAVMAIMLVLIFDISFSAIVASMYNGIKNVFTTDKSTKGEKEQKTNKDKSSFEEDDIPLPEPPPEKEYWTLEELEESFKEPEINIYNEKTSNEEKEEITDDEKQIFHEEIQNEIAENGEVMVYTYPTIDLLEEPEGSEDGTDRSKELKENALKLVETLKSFHVDAQVVEISCGPTVTRYEVKPAAGVKVSQITNLSKDIALKLAAKGGVMIAPVPGKPTIGIEIANANPSKVTLREVIDSDEFRNHKSKLAVALGKDISGAPVIMDLAKMPHLLIAGATGAGKSVCINTLIISLIYKADPNEVKLVMIDPKQVELGVYNGIPHLLIPVVKDAKKATGALSWAVQEMTERYSIFERHNVRNIQSYNELMELEGTPENKMPSIVIIIDEFADLMMVAPGDVENYVCRIAQLARAAGMHLVIATQRPVVKFITGNIKANVPSRISFMVASYKDSMTILDQGGAEKLVGKGDMLYMPVGETKPARMQCAFVSDEDVKKVVSAVSENCEAIYDASVIEQLEKEEEYKPDGDDPGDADELLPEAIEMAVDNGQISTSLLQRRFRIGYNRAGSIIDQMEQRGIISGLDGNRPRQVLITREQYNEMLMK